MGGRGGASGYKKDSTLAGQDGVPWPKSANENHLPFEGGYPDAVMNQLNGAVTHDESMEIMQAVYGFTGSAYEDIRKLQRGEEIFENVSKEYRKSMIDGVRKEADNLEKFISIGIKTGNGWNGGATYRGIGELDDKAASYIRGLKVGDSVDCNLGGTASWTTDRSAAEAFGGTKKGTHVTFVHLGSSQRGISVKNISNGHKKENEVMVSKDAKYRVTGIAEGKQGSNNIYVYVESD